MKVLRSLESEELRGVPSVALTIGVFDGVHLGHKKVIQTLLHAAARIEAAPVVLTFDPHPRQVLGKGSGAKLVSSVNHRLRLIGELGVRFCIVLPFEGVFAQQEATAFVTGGLLAAMNLKVICVGPDFVFGRGRRGDVTLLRKLGAEHGFSVEVVDAAEVGGIPVSSTAIRKCVEEGQIEQASRFLGRPYSLLGTVVPGKALGRQMGIPTANVSVEGELLPPAGVYTVQVVRKGGLYGGVMNIDRSGIVEVHLLNFCDTLYGEELEIVVGKMIREERDFPNTDALVAQMRSDVAIARQMLHNTTVINDKQ
ncbi:MAG: riboflavin biosynthesis protein RibF [Candidatus Aureabacteria bacterium]|nr:riboflavin biosynthesis protein RibF [Candidatus Auribacterota bacterium]